jgi:hypothetical protein
VILTLASTGDVIGIVSFNSDIQPFSIMNHANEPTDLDIEYHIQDVGHNSVLVHGS